jgi:hypothetical protein
LDGGTTGSRTRLNAAVKAPHRMMGRGMATMNEEHGLGPISIKMIDH